MKQKKINQLCFNFQNVGKFEVLMQNPKVVFYDL